MTVVQGEPLNRRPTIAQSIELSNAIGSLHRSLQNFPSEKIIRRRGIVTYESLVDHHKRFTQAFNEKIELFRNNNTIEVIARFLKLSKEVLSNYFIPSQFNELQNRIPRQIIHQDLWGANIFFQGEHFMGFIDFVNAKHCARIDEIAKHIIEVFELSQEETTSFLRTYNTIFPFTIEEEKLFLPWILNWVIFSPFWHLEKFIKKEETGLENRTRYVEMVNRSYKMLEQLKRGELDYLKEGAFLF